jgi:excisionase family DNA binding protein
METGTEDRIRVTPEGTDPERAAEAAGVLKSARKADGGEGGPVRLPPLELPSGAVVALEKVLEEFARGQSVVLSAEDAPGEGELSTTEAARELGMSRPTLINLLDEGHIGYRMVGSHRRIPRGEIAAYRKEAEQPIETARARRRRRLQALREMARTTDEAGEGY